ncbi:phosphatidylinositol glycan anchor biosynthesis class B [Lycorma delicatula]|uniref:phosphatidylinositol glycan anchor biosynthesis class B n=1 Tax=Lycorma delicatula TaxID=130591 RepID=UPI003F50EDA4
MSLSKLLLIMIALRVIYMFIVRSYFVPDEYWQSLEIAHKTVFGYGYVTWEWKEEIRSFFYPSCFTVLYKVLEILHLDYVGLLITLPRLIHIILSSVADVYFWLWLKTMLNKTAVINRKKLYWTYGMWIMCLFVNFCSSRTLTNTAELNFSTIALYYYPWNVKFCQKKQMFIWFVGLACLIRPTAAIQWLPLCIYNIVSNPNPFRYVCTVYLNVICKIALFSILIDLLFYKKLVLTPLNFILYNGQYNVGMHYGIHSWFWYIIIGIPVMLGPVFIFFYFIVFRISKFAGFCFYKYIFRSDVTGRETFSKIDILLCFTVIWTIFWYSVVPHKEFRFILPLAPVMFYLSSICLDLQPTKHRFYKILFVSLTLGTVIINVVGLVYLGLWHQVGPLSVISKLAIIAKENPKESNFLFLMPCHSTPLYSHIHVNVTTRILTCEPNLKNEPNYKDESDIFFDAPVKWLDEYFSTKDNCTIPSHIIFFSNLKPVIKSFLSHYKYSESDIFFNAHITQGRQSQFIEIFFTNKPTGCFT